VLKGLSSSVVDGTAERRYGPVQNLGVRAVVSLSGNGGQRHWGALTMRLDLIAAANTAVDAIDEDQRYCKLSRQDNVVEVMGRDSGDTLALTGRPLQVALNTS